MPRKFINLGITATFIYINDTPVSVSNTLLQWRSRICYCAEVAIYQALNRGA